MLFITAHTSVKQLDEVKGVLVSGQHRLKLPVRKVGLIVAAALTWLSLWRSRRTIKSPVSGPGSGWCHLFSPELCLQNSHFSFLTGFRLAGHDGSVPCVFFHVFWQVNVIYGH